MKLKYFIPSLMAAIAMLVSCSNDYEASYLGSVKVSKSLVALPATGGSVTVDFDATDSWTITNAPEWLTVSPSSGSAGATTVAFSAAEASATRECLLYLSCGKDVQQIQVLQMTEKADLPVSTCAQVLAGDDGKSFRVSGACTAIANTTYGNWYLNDGTGEVYIYGTLDKNGATKNFLSLGLEVGDVVTVEGPKTTYGGTVELVDVTVIKIEKSLIKCDSLSSSEPLPLEGGDVTAALTCKGNGVSVQIPDDAKSWLSVMGITTSGTSANVNFHAAPNTGGDRSTVITFVTTDGKKEYTSQATITQKGAIIECPIADFLAAEVGDTQFRLTGVITELYASDKQGKSFYISDYSGSVLIYRAEGFIEAGAKVGDVVTVVGKRGAYKDTPQMVNGNFESLNFAVETVSLSEFLAKEPAADKYYKIGGSIDEIANDQYGNLYLTDGTERVYVYGCYPGWGATGDARKGLIGNLGIKVGDYLEVIGVRAEYKGTAQLSNGIYFTHKAAE